MVSIEKVLISFNRPAKEFPHCSEASAVGGGRNDDCCLPLHFKTTERLTYLVEVYGIIHRIERAAFAFSTLRTR